jgi:hypothetical protein
LQEEESRKKNMMVDGQKVKNKNMRDGPKRAKKKGREIIDV